MRDRVQGESRLASSLAVINCSQLVTLAGPARPRVGPEMRELSIVADGAMLVKGDRIAKIGSREEIERLSESAGADCEVIDAGGRVVTAGFCRCAHASGVCRHASG